jgi:hypothetical protein
MCIRDRVASFPVVPLVGDHAFILFTDQEGNEYEYRGGPNRIECYERDPNRDVSDLATDPNYICVQTNRFTRETAVDWEAGHTAPRTVLMAGNDACSKRDCLNSAIQEINRLRIIYNNLPPVTNSNSVVRTLLHRCNIPVMEPLLNGNYRGGKIYLDKFISKQERIVNPRLYHNLIGLQIMLLFILTSRCTPNLNEGNMLLDARNTNEAQSILSKIFTPAVTTADEITEYLEIRGLNCTEMESADYDPDFADSFYDGSIVCWLPAPNAEARAKLSWLDSLLVSYVFRVVFLFEGETLSSIRVILDDRGP